MRMKKWLFSICLLNFFLLAGCGNNILIEEDSKTEVNTSSNILSYIVKDFNGNIAIFDSISNDIPIKVIDINTAFLPKADQEMLLKGIKVKDQTELSTLLEDLCS